MWMSLVEMNVWIRQRSAPASASAARVMSPGTTRASAAITATQDDGRTPVRRVTLDGLPDVPAFGVEAQPARIVLAALRGWLDPTPDLVLSGINHGANIGRAAGAGVPGHVHVHVLPRWAGDTNFLTTVAEARILPEPLTTSYAKLRAVWPG